MNYFLYNNFSVLQTILIKINYGKKIHIDNIIFIVEAHQLGLKYGDPTICNLSTFPCQQSDFQQRTLCGLVKPLCPVLKFTCRLCKFYLPKHSCRKTCQTYEKYCSSSGCSSSSSTPSEPPLTEIQRPTEPGK